MATPLDPPQHQNPRRDRQQELDRLQDAFDLQTGRKSKPTPWHKEPKLSKGKQEALDALDPKESQPSFYKESPEMAKRQQQFDETIHNRPAQGVGTWQATPVSKKERLLAWHKALGSPQHVVDVELKALEQQEARK